MSSSLWPHGPKHTRIPCPSLSPGVCSNSCPMSQWCLPTISSSVAPFSSYSQSFLASGSFPVSWLFTSDGQSIGAFSISPSNEYSKLISFRIDWFDLLAPRDSKGLSRVFSRTRIQKRQFYSSQPSLWSNSHIHTPLLESHSFDYMDLCRQSDVSPF